VTWWLVLALIPAAVGFGYMWAIAEELVPSLGWVIVAAVVIGGIWLRARYL
jgi:hypothetical protein